MTILQRTPEPTLYPPVNTDSIPFRLFDEVGNEYMVIKPNNPNTAMQVRVYPLVENRAHVG